jgi:hypothetical protein
MRHAHAVEVIEGWDQLRDRNMSRRVVKQTNRTLGSVVDASRSISAPDRHAHSDDFGGEGTEISNKDFK